MADIIAVPTPPTQRKKGWINYLDNVLTIEVSPRADNGVYVMRGHICSWPGSHGAGFEVDNVKTTIVYLDDPQAEDGMAPPDDVREKSFEGSDPHLIRREDAPWFKDPSNVYLWFEGVYSSPVCEQIAKEITKVYELPLEDTKVPHLRRLER